MKEARSTLPAARSPRKHHHRSRTQQRRLIRKSLLTALWITLTVIGLFMVINLTVGFASK